MGIMGMTVVVLFNTFSSIEREGDGDIFTTQGSVRATDSWQSLSEIVSNRAEIHFILNKQQKEIQSRKIEM